MRIVVKKVGRSAEVKNIKGELREMQEIVGGYIECIELFGNILCVCNEEGKLMGLENNFIFRRDYICGDVFFCSTDGEDFCGLEEWQAEFVMDLIKAIDN